MLVGRGRGREGNFVPSKVCFQYIKDRRREDQSVAFRRRYCAPHSLKSKAPRLPSNFIGQNAGRLLTNPCLPPFGSPDDAEDDAVQYVEFRFRLSRPSSCCAFVLLHPRSEPSSSWPAHHIILKEILRTALKNVVWFGRK